MSQSFSRAEQKTKVTKSYIEKNNLLIKRYIDIIEDERFVEHRNFVDQQLVNHLLCAKILNEILKSGKDIEKYCRVLKLSSDSFYGVLSGKKDRFTTLEVNRLIIKFIN